MDLGREAVVSICTEGDIVEDHGLGEGENLADDMALAAGEVRREVG